MKNNGITHMVSPFKEASLSYGLLAPSLFFLGVFVLYPAAQSFYLSFHDVDPFSGAITSVGWSHYLELLASPEYWNSVRTSLLFAFYTVPLAIILSLVIAALLDNSPYVRGLFRTIFLLPVGISPAMAAMLWVFLYNPTAGYLNYLLGLVGIDGPNWLSDSNWALLSVSIATVWKEIGFNVIFFLAGLAAVPDELKEAATIDGATSFKRFWYITLPLISPTLFFVATVSVIHAFESFGQIHLLTKGGPAQATNVLVYNLYRDAFQNFRTGIASAQAVLLFAVILVVTALQFQIAKRRIHYR